MPRLYSEKQDSCPKCDYFSKSRLRKFCEDPDCLTREEASESEEHLHVSCSSCKALWLERPADHNKAAKE
jgi:hypothetical protein